MRNVSDSSKIADAYIEPDSTAVHRAAGVVEGEGIISVAVSSSAESGRLCTACTRIFTDSADKRVFRDYAVLRMIVIAESLAVYVLEVVVADNIIGSCYRNGNIGTVYALC